MFSSPGYLVKLLEGLNDVLVFQLDLIPIKAGDGCGFTDLTND